VADMSLRVSVLPQVGHFIAAWLFNSKTSPANPQALHAISKMGMAYVLHETFLGFTPKASNQQRSSN
jgi:hypothetical protein